VKFSDGVGSQSPIDICASRDPIWTKFLFRYAHSSELITTTSASRGLPELTHNVITSSHGHFTPSLKISCKSVQPFSRNVADKEISIAASRGLPELAQKAICVKVCTRTDGQTDRQTDGRTTDAARLYIYSLE